jgi:hypothetical protein
MFSLPANYMSFVLNLQMHSVIINDDFLRINSILLGGAKHEP